MNCMNQFAMYNFNYCVKLVGADSYLATRIGVIMIYMMELHTYSYCTSIAT